MKKLLIYFTLLLSIAAQAQHPGYVRRSTRDQTIANAADSTSHIPAGTTPSLRGGWSGAGATFFNTSDSGAYYWTGTRWIRGSQEIYDHIVSGLGVSWNSGRTYDIAAGVAYVGGVRVTYAGGQVTLAVADGSNPRIDNIVLNNDGSGVTVITGTPSANPSKPTPDASTQFELTFAQLDAGASVPNGVTATVVWDGEGGDLWTGTTTGTVAFNNTVQAQHGTHSTFVSSGGLSGTQQITYKGATSYSVADFQNIKLYVWLNVALAGARAPDVSLLNGNNVITQVRPMTDLGLNRNLTGAWQTIIIPLSGFNYTNSSFTGLRIGRFNNTIGNFYIDNIQLGTLPIVTVGGDFLPLNFNGDQVVHANNHNLLFDNALQFEVLGPRLGGGQYSSILDVEPGFVDLQVNDLSGATADFDMIPGYMKLLSQLGGAASTIEVYPDSIRLTPFHGQLSIDSLQDGSGFDKVLAWNSATGAVGYTTGGGGGGGWVLSGNTTLTGNATIDENGNQLTIGGTAESIQVSSDGVILNSALGLFGASASTPFFGFQDNRGTPVGLEYLGDYTATFSDRSLIDKGYAVATFPVISSGATAPGSTPTKVGDIYVDTVAKKLYFATGTSSSADWTIAN